MDLPGASLVSRPDRSGGVVLPRHPFDNLYNHGFRNLTGTRARPPNGAPRRFACALAAAWLGATGLAFQMDAMTAGHALGGALIAVAGLVSVTHFCNPSLLYQANVSAHKP